MHNHYHNFKLLNDYRNNFKNLIKDYKMKNNMVLKLLSSENDINAVEITDESTL